MTTRADPRFLKKLARYGNVRVEECFNCGNCTAVCPLSSEGDSFPRRMIRYAQLGMKDRLLGSRDLWMCYSCGECTQTCPRQADPAQFMAASRKYAIAKYDPLGLAKLLFTSPALSLLLMSALAVVFAGFMYTVHGPMAGDSLRLFEFIPAWIIHDLGLAVMLIVFAAGLWGVARMALRVGKADPPPRGAPLNWLAALWETLGLEVLGQERYRQDCETATSRPAWYAQKWFVHASMMWGFFGLLGATALDYGLDLVGLRPTGTWVPIWYPVRLLGTIAGLFLLYGVSVTILRRLRHIDPVFLHSEFSDWAFLGVLWLTAVSGFALELSLYLPHGPIWAYWMLLGHVAVAMELVLLAPFTKFAHVFYRTLALYLHALRPMAQAERAREGDAA